jgi:hypothetical protein
MTTVPFGYSGQAKRVSYPTLHTGPSLKMSTGHFLNAQFRFVKHRITSLFTGYPFLLEGYPAILTSYKQPRKIADITIMK